jgi:tetratricopeptide (TPR) repeat protein
VKTLSVFIIPLLLTGCALYSDHYQGTRALDRGAYDEAIALLEKASEASPDDPEILTDLGVAYFKKANLQEAIRHLEKAKSLDPTYGKPYPYLGMIYEKQDDFQKAIGEYSIYCEKYPLTRTGRHLKARIGVLMRKQIAREIQAAIQQEKGMPVQSIPENTIAVSYFSNLTGDKEWDLLRKGLTDILIIDFSKVKSLKVVERMRMNILMKEMEMSASDLVESSTAPRVGKILGARRIINGGIAAPQKDLIRIDALATNVVSAWTDAHADVMDQQDRFFQMEKDLVFAILDELGVELSREELEAIQRIPTESFAAFLAYSLGLDYEDRGMYREAAEQFQKAVQIDPGFSRANEKFQEAQVLSETHITGEFEELALLEQSIIAEAEPGLSSADRLQVIAQNGATGFLPDQDETSVDERTTPEQQRTATLNVIAEW